MEQQSARLRNTGFLTFFFSGICAISAGVVVSLLQERYGFAYGMTGTLLSLMSVGNLLAGLLIGMLSSVLGMKPSVLLLTIGYAVGYGIMGLTGVEILLAVAFFVVGIAKGSVINTCTILVSDHSADRTRGMNLMHSCYACGALLCPFLIAAAAKVSTELAVFLLNPEPEAVELAVKLHEFRGLRQIEHLKFGTGELETRNTFEHPEAAVMQRTEGEKAYEKGETLLLEGYSFHVIRYKETI